MPPLTPSSATVAKHAPCGCGDMGLLPHSLPVPVTCCRIVSPFAASCRKPKRPVSFRLLPSPSVDLRRFALDSHADLYIRTSWRDAWVRQRLAWPPRGPCRSLGAPPTGRTLTPSRSPASIPFHPLAYRVPPWRTVQFRSGQANLPKKQHNPIDLLIRIRNKYRTVVVCRRRATCPCEKRSGTKRNCKIFHTPL